MPETVSALGGVRVLRRLPEELEDHLNAADQNDGDEEAYPNDWKCSSAGVFAHRVYCPTAEVEKKASHRGNPTARDRHYL